MDAPTAIVIGHSFVKRLSHWIGSHHSMAPTHPGQLCDNLREINLLGVSGLFASEIHEGDFLFQASRHDIVILDCGTNDLANDIPIRTVMNNVFLFARRCLEEGTTIVFILSVLPRTRRIKSTDTQFLTKVREYNNLMKSTCVPEPNISFHRQSGFSNVQEWSEDGIHPSPNVLSNGRSGMTKYSNSIKTALHRAVHRHRFLHHDQALQVFIITLQSFSDSPTT